MGRIWDRNLRNPEGKSLTQGLEDFQTVLRVRLEAVTTLNKVSLPFP